MSSTVEMSGQATGSLADLPQPSASPTASRLMTQTGLALLVRTAVPEDETALAELFAGLTREDLRFRFLSPLKAVSSDVLGMMTHVDHERTENFLAFDEVNNRLVASAMLASDPSRDCAEVALAVRADYKHRGVSWTLLEYVARCAKDRGIKTLQSIEDRAHSDAISLEREMGFTSKAYPGDATLLLLEADLTTM